MLSVIFRPIAPIQMKQIRIAHIIYGYDMFDIIPARAAFGSQFCKAAAILNALSLSVLSPVVFFLFVSKNIRTLFHLNFKYIVKFFLCHVINPPSVIRGSMK